jgi:allophanate hydrolase subunit 1
VKITDKQIQEILVEIQNIKVRLDQCEQAQAQLRSELQRSVANLENKINQQGFLA